MNIVNQIILLLQVSLEAIKITMFLAFVACCIAGLILAVEKLVNFILTNLLYAISAVVIYLICAAAWVKGAQITKK